MKIFNWTYALRLRLLNDRAQASWNEELIVHILIYKKEEKENIRHGMSLLRFKLLQKYTSCNKDKPYFFKAVPQIEDRMFKNV